jgi:hypothetical protein
VSGGAGHRLAARALAEAAELPLLPGGVHARPGAEGQNLPQLRTHGPLCHAPLPGLSGGLVWLQSVGARPGRPYTRGHGSGG